MERGDAAMRKIKKAVVVLTPFATEEDARRAITAAHASDAVRCEIWAFNQPKELLCQLPVDNVIRLDMADSLLSEQYLPMLAVLAKEHEPDVLLFTGGHFALELAAELGCTLGGSCALSITGLHRIPEGLAAIRRVYGLQLEAEMEFLMHPYVFSLAEKAFIPCEYNGKPTITDIQYEPADASWCTDYEETLNTTTSLKEHELVLIGGRGLGNDGTAKTLQMLALQLDAGIGGTRPAVLNTWFPSGAMIGLSGQTITPKFCIVFGASGCTPFIKGIEGSGMIAAVNQDPDAMIFRQCDLGLIGDCSEIIQELTKIVRRV